jgi:DNA modification methylase
MLGRFKLNEIYNEDSYKAIKDIPDKSIDLIYTDPPYQFGTFNKGSFGERNPLITEDTKNSIEKISNGIDYNILNEFVRVMKFIHIYIWCNDKQIIDYFNFFVNKYNCDYKVLGWIKSNPMPMFNKRMLDDVEYCLLFTEKNRTMFRGCCSFDNSFKFYHEPINIKDKNLYNHPTIKPLLCVKNHIEKATKKDDILFDPFLGSGTTCVAAKELGRKYIGFEIDKKYFKIAKDRLDGMNQIERNLIEKGQTSLF